MQAIIVREIGSFEIADIKIPKPGRGDVLVKVAVTGLCRTDLKIIEAGHRDLVLPRVPGEEVVGIVYKTGPGVDSIRLGTSVYVYPGTSCGLCRTCRQGAPNLCPDMRIMGFHRDGGFAEYVTAPAASLIPIPTGLSFDEAVLAEPLSCCLNALELARVEPEDQVAIWGAGPAGTLLCRATKALDAVPTVIEPDPRRRMRAGGVTGVPSGIFDAAIVATGSKEAYNQAIACLGPRGRLVVFSGLPRDAAQIPVNFNTLHYREQSITGAYGCSYRHGEQALAWIAQRRVPVADMISHRLKLDDLGIALDLVRNRAGMKILLYLPKS